jgi:phosphohistidine phosphatase
MKALTLLRHAKSDWGDEQLDDFDRPLNERGRVAAEAIGRELKRRGVRFDRVAASPALRVRQTLEHLWQGYGEELDAAFDEAIYTASGSGLLRIVRELPDGSRSPLVVGHNPGLQQLALELTDGTKSELRERVAEKYPTAAVAMIRVQPGSWRQPQGELTDLIIPRELEQR